MNEQHLHREVSLGEQARLVIENETYQAAWAAVEAEILESWKRSTGSAEDREQLHRMLQAHHRVRQHMQSMLETGQMAKRSLLDRLKRGTPL